MEVMGGGRKAQERGRETEEGGVEGGDVGGKGLECVC